MIGITGTRVIVVDDDEGEALPILKILAKQGIPAAFFDGSPDGLPGRDARLSGVRLAILDMDLLGGGASGKTKAAGLVRYLEGILSPANGPYGVLAWTNHPEMLDEFERYLFADTGIANPIFTLMLTKAECKDRSGRFDLTVISSKVGQALSNFSPLMFMQAWEEKCFEAATGVTNALATLVSDHASDLLNWRENWKVQFLRLMCAMVKAEAGENIGGASCLVSLYGSLNPLHADKMENDLSEMSRALGEKSAEILSVSGDCSIEVGGKVNTMLHLAFENLDQFAAGNLYAIHSKEEMKWIPDTYGLLQDMVRKAATQEETTKRIEALMKVSIPLLIETNATCDHAQKNIRFARFIYGLIIPASEQKQFKFDAGFIWKFGPLFLNDPLAISGVYYFCFSARHLLSLDLETALAMKAQARLRGQAFADLQAWFARQSSRPGVMLLNR